MLRRHILVSLILLFLIASPAVSGPQLDVVGFWTMEFQPGYNLVTFPVLPSNPAISNVFDNQLENAEIYTWDSAINDWRISKFNTQTNRWEGNLFLLDRGKAYWVKIPYQEEPKRVVVTGNPEIYTRFNWSNLGGGWQFYAPTIGKDERLNDIPPQSNGDLLINWDPVHERFDLTESVSGRWSDLAPFQEFQADKAYITYQHSEAAMPIGPRSLRDYLLEQRDRNHNPTRDNPGGLERAGSPPRPVIVGNTFETPICFEDGSICTGGFSVIVYKEQLRNNNNGEQEIVNIRMTEHQIPEGRTIDGAFRIALTVGNSPNYLNAGDRAFLLILGPQNTSTQSSSFEIPEYGRFIPDVHFTDPLLIDEQTPVIPIDFTVSSPFPNPFNDRFNVDFGLPQSAEVRSVLYDVNGRVAWEANRLFVAGYHRLSVHPVGVAAGVYFLEMKSNHYRNVVKVVYVK